VQQAVPAPLSVVVCLFSQDAAPKEEIVQSVRADVLPWEPAAKAAAVPADPLRLFEFLLAMAVTRSPARLARRRSGRALVVSEARFHSFLVAAVANRLVVFASNLPSPIVAVAVG
jgi:hypothetical protein